MRTTRLMARPGRPRRYLFTWLLLAGLLAACRETPTIVSPLSPSPDPPGNPAPVTNPPTGLPLTGIVFEATAGGRRPVSGARVFVVDLLGGPYGDYGWYESVADTDGRFTISDLLRGRSVKITAYDGPDSGLWNQSDLNQVCAVHPTIDGNTSADVELVRDGRVPTTYGSPILSGVVFDTSKERRPVAGAPVLYSSFSHDGADVYTRTDVNGRYSFCRLPLSAGYVLAGCPGIPRPAGSSYTQASVEIRGDTVLDLDVTPLMSRCQG